MKKSKILIIIGFILIASSANSQSDFRPGYYITNSNDTIYGLIDYRGEIRNSKQCVFKQTENSQLISFEPGDIFGYRFIEGKYFVSKTIKRNSIEKKIFLEYLLKGVTDLYYYRDDQTKKDYYYIEINEGDLTELKNDEIETHVEGKGNGIWQTRKHIGILKVAFSDCQEIQPRIEQTKLNHQSLINIAKKYHNYVCDGEKCIVYEKKPNKVKFRYGVIPGIGISSLVTEDNYGNL